MLQIVILVLRETLEASIFVGILLSLGKQANINARWLAYALVLGAGIAFLYGKNIAYISDLFDYTGQEVVNASIQYVIYIGLVFITASQFLTNPISKLTLQSFMIALVTLSIAREGSELYVFYSSFIATNSDFIKASTIGFIGLGVGMSAGAVVYYLLVTCPPTQARALQSIALTLIAGGMVIQASQLLIQADFLPAGPTIWDSNGLLPESSLLGQLAYALFGYEATPSGLEAISYSASIVVMTLTILSVHLYSKSMKSTKRESIN